MASPRTTRDLEAVHVLPGNVYDAALRRIRWLWDEFDGRVTVSFSGGKDSTTVMELALKVARERDALPLRVKWLDQECEFAATVRYAEYVASRPEIDFLWYQIPFRLFNATDHENPWLNVWGEGEEWARPKDPRAIHVNDFGVDRFVELLEAMGDRQGGAILTGVRVEESPARRLGMLSYPGYKWVTWTKKGKDHTVFHPVYDFTYRDIWKAICDGDDPEHPGERSWRYNTHYDTQFRYGIPVRNMRVSNYHHETAIHSLFYLQEAEPETWNHAVQRLNGINTAGMLGKDDFQVHKLPFMFGSWLEYHEYLVDNLIPEANRDIFRNHVITLRRILPYVDVEEIAKHCVGKVIVNDIYYQPGKGHFYITRHDAEKTGKRRKQPGQRKGELSATAG